jgi:hypothetical protein
VGLSHRREFSEIVLSLRDQVRIQTIDNLTQIDRDKPPELVILAHSRPDEFSATAVGELRESWPHVRFISLLGSWCTGQRHTDSRLCHIPSIYVGQWRSRIGPDELRSVGARLHGAHEPPPCNYQIAPPTNAPLVAIYSPSVSYRQALADALANAGCKVVAARMELPVQILGVDFVLWEIPRGFGRRREEISILRTRHAQAELIGLATFPRDFEVESLCEASVQHVVSQPFRLADLTKTIARSVSHAKSSAA